MSAPEVRKLLSNVGVKLEAHSSHVNPVSLVCGCFHTETAELNRCHRGHMACIFENILQKMFLTPAVRLFK